jgi:hypothetical protein
MAAVGRATKFCCWANPATFLQQSLRAGTLARGLLFSIITDTAKLVQTITNGNSMENQVFMVGDRTDNLCAVCDEEQGRL